MDLPRFHLAAWTACDQAREAAPLTPPLWLDLAGSILRLNFAGPAMADNVTPALAHLAISPRDKPDLDIAIWDSASTGVNMPPPPWSASDYLARGEIRGVGAQSGIDVAYHPGSGVLSMLKATDRRGMMWMHDARGCPYWESAAPLRTLLSWWCSRHRQQLVHGAAVGTPEGAILLTGKGGSGKSTTALSALLEGLDYIGDDYVLCELTDRQPVIHSLFNTAKLDAKALERLPALRSKLNNRDQLNNEKGVIFTHSHFPGQVCRSRQLRAIVIPSVSGTPTSRLAPLKPALAFLAISPTTVFQLPGARENALAFLKQLVEELPCYQLQLGADPVQTANLIKQFLAGAA